MVTGYKKSSVIFPRHHLFCLSLTVHQDLWQRLQVPQGGMCGWGQRWRGSRHALWHEHTTCGSRELWLAALRVCLDHRRMVRGTVLGILDLPSGQRWPDGNRVMRAGMWETHTHLPVLSLRTGSPQTSPSALLGQSPTGAEWGGGVHKMVSTLLSTLRPVIPFNVLIVWLEMNSYRHCKFICFL